MIRMKKNIVALITVFIAVVIIAGGFYIIDNSKGNEKRYVVPNDGLVSITEFNISDESVTDSFVNGTFFVSKENDNLHIKMVANTNVEEKDTGGIQLYALGCLSITDIICSSGGNTSDDYVATWTTSGDMEKYHIMVEVARTLCRPYTPPGGGHGMCIIEYDVDMSAIGDATSLDFGIAFGTQGDSTGVVHDTISVPLYDQSHIDNA